MKKKIILCNRIAILAGLLVMLPTFNFIKIPTLFFIMGSASLTYVSPIIFNRLKWYNFSRFILVVTPPLYILLGGGLMTSGPNYTYKYALISVIIAPILLFQLSEKVKMWIGIGWVILSFISYDTVMNAIPRLPEIQSDQDVDGPVFVMFGGLISMVFFIMAFNYLMDINKKYEKRLSFILLNAKQKNHLISQKNILLEGQYKSIQEQQQEIEQINQMLRSQVLKAQMNPHFIFNCLNSIQHFIIQNDAASAMSYMSKFSKLMRQVLENSTNENVPIADEMKTLTYYIELEQLRYNNSFKFEFSIDEQIDQLNTEMPSMLLQPFVENAIIHGFRNKNKPGFLKVILLYQHERILCIIEDNGIGRAAAAKFNITKNMSHKSRAIDINTKRISLMQSNATIITQDLTDSDGNPAGTRVEINIPANNNFL
ncbi:MAG: histidine kinase [Chitinophagaceae bacterium]|nr:histidine kinase [Chitinophagaceae bacterium]